MTVEDLEKAVATLPEDQLAKFRAWFEAFDAARFDQKIERDLLSGKLDRLAEEALDDLRKGRPASYEALGEPRILGSLPEASRAGSRSRRQELRLAERKSAASVVAVQEGRTFLVRSGRPRYRALAVEAANDLVWFWIGSHADYDVLIGSRTCCT